MDQQSIQDLSASGHHKECLQACQKFLQTDPENPLFWKFAGKSLIALGEAEKAQKYLKRAYQLDKVNPETANDIGNTYLNLGNRNAAAEWYKRSLEFKNNYAPAFNNLANIAQQCGNNQEALELFRRAIKADPKLIQAYLGAVASFFALGDLDQAEAFVSKAIEINNSYPGANETLGIIFQNKKNPQQAIKS